MGLLSNLVTRFSTSAYDAANGSQRRRQVATVLKTEDDHANERQRRILSANTRDLARNFEIAAWAIRKHLDFVTSFSFQAKTSDAGFNETLETFMASAMTKERFDSARRHPFRRAIRLAEACAVKDGDVCWLKLIGGASRGQIQGIEADRICTPSDVKDPTAWVNGIRIGGDGASLAYAVCDRGRSGQRELQRIVSAKSMLHRGFFDRYDQVRGISPVAAALNRFRDTYEGFEYALAKAKLAQLFGLVFSRDGESNPFAPAVDATADKDGDGVNDSDHEVNLGKGIFSLDLDVGEDAKILESATPASETVNFLKLMIHVALKSLDIPYSFFDESFTNFYGSRGGLVQYLKSCEDEIADLQDFADEWALWRIGVAVADGEIELPAGKDFTWLDWEFVPAGVPWWDAVKEVRGSAMAIAAGLSSPQRECRMANTNFKRNVIEIAEAKAFAQSVGVDLKWADSTAFAPEVSTAAGEAEPKDEAA